MELLWAFTKLLEYVLFGPVWWAASHLAAVFFPYEGDNNHLMLAILFAALLTGLLIFAGFYLLS